jgi:hypothetical protein
MAHISNGLSYSQHSLNRTHQRGISPLILEWLLIFGDRKSTNGAEIFYFTQASRKRLRAYIGGRTMAKFDSQLDAYAVIVDGRIITAGHRNKRLFNR